MPKIVLHEKTGLWRILDGRSGKPLRTKNYRAVDEGGQRTEIDAWRLLNAYENQKKSKGRKR